MFRKKKIDPPVRRTRQPAAPELKGSRAVFSYHATQTARDAAANAPRSANKLKLSWLNPQPPTRPRRVPRPWSKRFSTIAVAVLGLVMLIYGLTVSRTPAVVALSDDAASRILLREPHVYEEAAQAILRSSLAYTNKLTIDTTRITHDMQRQFPELAHVSVALPFIGRQPTMYIQAARPVLVLSSGGRAVVLDTSGRALLDATRVPHIDRLKLPIVEDQSGLPMTVGQTILPASNVVFITEVVGQLRAKGIAMVLMTLPKGTSELDLRLEGASYIVKFNLRGDARAEAGTYLAVRHYLEQGKRMPNSYIDVRVDNRAYYQ